MNPHELKSLQTQIAKARVVIEEKLSALRQAQSESDRARSYLVSLEKKLSEALENSEVPIVTEHALLRLMERVYGVSIEEMQRKILTPATLSAIRVMKSGTIPLECGGRAVIKDNRIISITD